MKRSPKRIATRFAINGVVSYCAWLALVEQNANASNLLLFLVWAQSLIALILLNSAVIKDLSTRVDTGMHTSIDAAFDVALVAALSWYGWQWSAAAYLFHTMLLASARAEARKLHGKQQQEGQEA